MDKKLMMAWLQGQAQKQELTTTKMQQKRLGITENTVAVDSTPQAQALRKKEIKQEMAQKSTIKNEKVHKQPSEIYEEAPQSLSEQLSAEEEKYAKEHKSMLTSMIKQYGKEKGTRVFYASVRNAVKKNK